MATKKTTEPTEIPSEANVTSSESTKSEIDQGPVEEERVCTLSDQLRVNSENAKGRENGKEPIEIQEEENSDEESSQEQRKADLRRLIEYDTKKQMQNVGNFEKKDPLPLSICELLGIDPDGEINKSLRVMATQDNYTLIHYTTPIEGNYPYRGIILDTKTNEMVCRSIPFVPEYCIDDIKEGYEKEVMGSMKGLEMREVFYGVYVRLFYDRYEKTWLMSTHRKIDGLSSHWGGQTFGSIFSQFFRGGYKELNKDCCYVFLMSHPDLGPVYENWHVNFRIVDVFDLKNSRRIRDANVKGRFGRVKYLKRVTGLSTMGDVRKYVSECNPSECIGLLIRTRKRLSPRLPCRRVIKITHPRYALFRAIIGNEMSLRTRYVELLRISKDLSNVLLDMIPSLRKEAARIEKTMGKLVPELARVYNIRNIEKKRFHVVPAAHSILKATKLDVSRFTKAPGKKTNEEIQAKVEERIAFYLNTLNPVVLASVIEQCDFINQGD